MCLYLRSMQNPFLIALFLLFSTCLIAQEGVRRDTSGVQIKREYEIVRDTTVSDTIRVLKDRPVLQIDTTGVKRDSAYFVSDSVLFVPDQQREPQEADTVKPPKILRQWTLSSDFSEEVPMQVDTIFNMSQRSRIADKYSPVNAMLGNYGLPTYQIHFFDRVSDPDKFLYAHYYPFMYVPEKAIFMNTQFPFTELNWTFGGQRTNSEQTFRVRHSQNVNRFLNFGVIYDIIYSLGQYNYQRADDKNFTFHTSYTGDRYKLYFSAGVNNMTSFENGGMTNPDQALVGNMRDILVNLVASNAVSTLKNRSVLLVQRYTIGGRPQVKGKEETKSGVSGTFSHILAFENNKREYKDDLPTSGFYDSVYINVPNRATHDSLFSSSIKNTIRFDFSIGENRKFRLGAGGGIRNEAYRFSQIIPTFDTTIADTTGRGRISNVLTGRLYSSFGNNFRWVATGDLYINGYRTGDFSLNGNITKSFSLRKGLADWVINGSLVNRQPSYWLQRWGSTHFAWDRSMNKELRFNLGTGFIFPGRNTDIRFNYAIIDNYTAFDTAALPFQHNGGLSVAALKVSKSLRLWKFHLATDLIFQQSSNTQVLDLPFMAIRSAAYFEHLFRFPATKGELNTQIGADVTFNSDYHPYAYMPATGRFYNQDQFTSGSYPYINVFVNLKLKRTRIFIMFDHLNAGETGYFMVPSYPMNIRMMRYGFAWTFYD